jgi:NitT/TauT family transport system permease protein
LKNKQSESGIKERLSRLVDRTDTRIFLLISAVLGILVWQLISKSIAGAVFASPSQTFQAFLAEAASGRLLEHTYTSLYRVLAGFLLALVVAIPVAFLMGWYKICRLLIEPWIQFIRNIPPIAYIPLVIVAQGVGESAKVTVIFIASFLVMVVSIYQGVKNVDVTLIKAARVLGANDRHIFFRVVVPASFPFILVGLRLGLSAALTTLVAAELTGAQMGLGQMIQEASLYFRMEIVLLGIVIIGIIGFILDKTVLYLERRLAGWQEVRQ